MTNEHDSAVIAATSLRVKGEVWRKQFRQSLRVSTDAYGVPIGVVDGSRSGREDACESRRSVGIRPSFSKRKRCSAEVRAAIVVKKRGNSRGAKGGRKVNVQAK